MTYRWKIELILFDLQFAEHVTRYTTYAVLFTHPITHLTLAIQETGTAMPWSHSLMWCSCVNPAYQAKSMALLPSNIFLWVRGSVLTRESELIQTKSTQTWTPRTCGRYENKKKIFCVSITDLLRVDLFEYLLTHWVKCFQSELIKAISRLCLLMLVLWNHLFIEFISLYSELMPTRFYKRELTINLVLCFDLRFTKMASSCTILMRQTSPPQAGCDS